MHAQETVCQVSYPLYEDAWHVMRLVNFFLRLLPSSSFSIWKIDICVCKMQIFAILYKVTLYTLRYIKLFLNVGCFFGGLYFWKVWGMPNFDSSTQKAKFDLMGQNLTNYWNINKTKKLNCSEILVQEGFGSNTATGLWC